jgi:hypothetical protein
MRLCKWQNGIVNAAVVGRTSGVPRVRLAGQRDRDVNGGTPLTANQLAFAALPATYYGAVPAPDPLVTVIGGTEGTPYYNGLAGCHLRPALRHGTPARGRGRARRPGLPCPECSPSSVGLRANGGARVTSAVAPFREPRPGRVIQPGSRREICVGAEVEDEPAVRQTAGHGDACRCPVPVPGRSRAGWSSYPGSSVPPSGACRQEERPGAEPGAVRIGTGLRPATVRVAGGVSRRVDFSIDTGIR